MSRKTKKSVKQTEAKLENGIYADAILGNAAMINGAQVSQAATMFNALRGYLLTNNFMLLNRLYAEIGIIQTLVDIPVDHSLKGGFEINTDLLDAEEIEALISDIVDKGEDEEVKYVLKWNRLFGGAGLVTLGAGEADKELEIKNIKQGDEIIFRAADLWELNSNMTIPEDYGLGTDIEKLKDGTFSNFYYYGSVLNKSRVCQAKGKRAPSHIRAMLRGWGLSEVEGVARSINQYLKTTDLTFEVLDEFKIDVFKFKGLKEALVAPKGREFIQERITTANLQKNYQEGIALDSEDDFAQKTLSFAGIAEIMNENKKQVASDLRFPLTILFGQSSAGFNSGEDDIENFNSMCESTIRPHLHRLLRHVVLCRAMSMYGVYLEDLKVELKPLRELSAEQSENVKTQRFNRVSTARQQGDIDSREYREAVNKGDLIGVKLQENKKVQELNVRRELE